MWNRLFLQDETSRISSYQVTPLHNKIQHNTIHAPYIQTTANKNYAPHTSEEVGEVVEGDEAVLCEVDDKRRKEAQLLHALPPVPVVSDKEGAHKSEWMRKGMAREQVCDCKSILFSSYLHWMSKFAQEKQALDSEMPTKNQTNNIRQIGDRNRHWFSWDTSGMTCKCDCLVRRDTILREGTKKLTCSSRIPGKDSEDSGRCSSLSQTAI